MTSKVTGQQWIRTTDRATGRQLAVAVPSQSTPGLYHLVSRKGCTCKGFEYRGRCRHYDEVMVEVTSQLAAERFAAPRSFDSGAAWMRAVAG